MNYDFMNSTQRKLRLFFRARGNKQIGFMKIYENFSFSAMGRGGGCCCYFDFPPGNCQCKGSAALKISRKTGLETNFIKKDCRNLIYVYFEDLTLSDNQLLRGGAIFPFSLAKKIPPVCHNFPQNFSRRKINSLFFSWSAQRRRRWRKRSQAETEKFLKQKANCDEKCSKFVSSPSQFI